MAQINMNGIAGQKSPPKLSIFFLGCLIYLAATWLGGCTETTLLATTAKTIRALGEGPPTKGHYKLGNPYQIKGVWYYPKIDYAYDESGVASWYGPNFHNKPTANGETFDQNAVSAAHRTLPLPSVVRVTNLENGRALLVRVNDRGPFAHGRIIDLSKRAGQLLGFERQGVARVRVQILPEESRATAKLAQSGGMAKSVVQNANAPDAVPVSSVSVSTLTPLPGSQVAPKPAANPNNKPIMTPTTSAVELTRLSRQGILPDQPFEPTKLFVQAASFLKQDNARKLKSKLSDIGMADIYGALVSGKELYRVRIGPLDDVGQADKILAKVIARGFPGARIIVD